ncbi:armadillo-type protein [Podospora conica]|nr:armadillo-type protein [Schizothecium conicum]
MATSESPEERTWFFQQLKAICVPLSQLALRSTDLGSDAKEIIRLIQALTAAWTAQVSRNATILDHKLAGYVFFPLSHLLRKQDQLPVRVIEASIQLLTLLIKHGWKNKISPELTQQFLLFLSFTISGVPGQKEKRQLPEETLLEGFRALTVLLTFMDASPSALSSPETSAKLIPALGQSVTVMLDGVTDGIAPLIQLEALTCLQTVFTVVSDASVLAQFLPGTVSALSKVLSPPLQPKMQRRVLIAALAVLQTVLLTVFSDIKIRGIIKERDDLQKLEDAKRLQLQQSGDGAETSKDLVLKEAPQEEADGYRVKLSASWLKATSAQVKIALSSVMKLRNHDYEDVQSALYKLCIALLDECHASLVDCQSILVESAMTLEDEETMRSPLQTSLSDLCAVYPELADGVKLALYDWVKGLPRVMLSNDERIKRLAVRNVLRGSKLASSLQLDSSILDNSLGDSLRDSIVALLKNSKPPKVFNEVGTEVALASGTGLVASDLGMDAYSTVLLGTEGQKETRAEIMKLISRIGSPALQTKIASDMLDYVRDSEGEDQIASYWLAFELLKANYSQSASLDEFVDFSSFSESQGQEQAFGELYDFSASVLSSHSDSTEVDWRLEAIALEVTAFAAHRLGPEFRPELIDVLYPIATFLGSAAPQLRSHAITTLNILAASCGYKSVSDLIIDNADYMVNSVSLRLNTLDISPASTKVLTMLIHLTGPKLIPFLDDVVQAIFAALDNYHGYPVFVENMFSVLSEVVTQGVKSDMLLLEDANTTKTVDHKKRKPTRLGINRVLDILEARSKRQTTQPSDPDPDSDSDVEEVIRSGHPTEPWGPDKSEAKSLLDQLENPDSDSDPDPNAAVEKPPNPEKTPTYTLLTRVLSLTQYYLTSPTPALRKSLLDLVATVGPALAPDENAFLPLVNTVWPVVVARLHDPEPFVAVAACKALAALCAAAGDFLSSRFAAEWAGGLRRWFVKVRAEAARAGGGGGGSGSLGTTTTSLGASSGVGRDILIPGRAAAAAEGEGMLVPATTASSVVGKSSGGGLGRFAQAAQVWSAAVGLMGAIVTYVRVEDGMFDEMLELVVDVVPRNEALRGAFEVVNADAVWLAMYQRGMVEVGEGARPVMEGVRSRHQGPQPNTINVMTRQLDLPLIPMD